MKKAILVFLSLITYHLSPSTAWAASAAENAINNAIGKITPPPQVIGLGAGNIGIGRVLTNLLSLIYIVAGIVFLFMIVIGAFQMITSGGDKEAVANSQKRITYAIIGIVLLALAFVIVRLVGQITGFKFI